MKTAARSIALFLSLVYMLGGATGCTAFPAHEETLEYMPTERPTILPPEAALAEQTLMPLPAATLGPTLTPVWTPRPTLAEAEAAQALRDLIMTNGGCGLPCVWGLTPGETTWRDAEAILLTFSP